MKDKITKALLKVIPGGAHTYSRGSDQYPINAPSILSRGKGAYIFDNKNKKLLDYGMGLRSVNIGYAENSINQGAIKQINNGNNLTRPSNIELKAANLLISTIKSAEMVKFTKNGSTAVTAAVKLARAYNKKDLVIRCIDHPFFSFDDWFIGSTVVDRGIPDAVKKLTLKFRYNDIESLKKIIKKFKKKVSCIVLEPAATDCPKVNNESGCCGLKNCERNFKKQHFLKEVENICKNNNIVFILDETITGFRWNLQGAQHLYGLDPDISIFGKAMANGFSVACVSGKKKIMELGSITNKKEERVFLLSTTHGAEMSSLGAFVETLNFIKKNNVIKKNWEYGYELKKNCNQVAKDMGILENFKFSGPSGSPYYLCLDSNNKPSLEFRTLFLQEMIKNGVFMPWVAISFRHSKKELSKTISAIEKSLFIYKKALQLGSKKFIKGPIVKPVFRKFN
jgi:glutamate-1-semialdehyde 2,1-aminomutase